jgi:hypothetical protein
MFWSVVWVLSPAPLTAVLGLAAAADPDAQEDVQAIPGLMTPAPARRSGIGSQIATLPGGTRSDRLAGGCTAVSWPATTTWSLG